jgi:hypothetical protein
LEVDQVIVYRSADKSGRTFALSPQTKNALKEKTEGKQKYLRVFIANEEGDEVQEEAPHIIRAVFRLLTGLSKEEAESLGPIEVRDPVKEDEHA